MARSVIVNNIVRSIPDPGDVGYGSSLSDFLEALAGDLLDKSGGSFTLSADVDFGASFGLKSLYLKSTVANPAAAGLIRAANTDSIRWRNNANTGDLVLDVSSLDELRFNGNVLAAGGTVTSVSVTDPVSGLVVTGDPITTSGTLVFALANDLAAVEGLAGIGYAKRTGVDAWAIEAGADLDALEGLSGTGIAVRTSSNTWAQRSIIAPAAGFSIANGSGAGGNPTFSLANDLAGIEGLGSTGFPVRVAPETWAQRIFLAGAGMHITSGNGVADNPIISAGISALPGGRLTIITGAPVADGSGATTLFYTPYKGDLTPIWDGSSWLSIQSPEISLAFATSGAGFQAANTNYDVFVVNDAGAMRIGTGPAWISGTVRGTGAGTSELISLNGFDTNAVSMTLRWGSGAGDIITVPANRATYVGSIRMTSDGVTEDSEGIRFVDNAYHRVLRALVKKEATNSWTYSTATTRQTNANTANRVEVMRGRDEDSCVVSAHSVGFSNTAGVGLHAGVGLDSTTVFSGFMVPASGTASDFLNPYGRYAGRPGLGYHAFNWLERGSGTGVQTWLGDNGGTIIQSGITGEVMV